MFIYYVLCIECDVCYNIEPRVLIFLNREKYCFSNNQNGMKKEKNNSHSILVCL